MFTSEVGMYLKKIGNHLERGKNRRLKTLGLTGTQMEMMEYLYYQNQEKLKQKLTMKLIMLQKKKKEELRLIPIM